MHDAAWLITAKAQLRDLGKRNPAIYWTDFLLSISFGYLFLILYLGAWQGVTLPRVACFCAAAILLFRATSFAHEVVHFRPGEMTAFKVGWDLICGIPLFFPSFAYTHHLDHHRCESFGTKHDGEYLPFGVNPVPTIGRFVFINFLWPLLVAIRFTFLTPLSFLYPPFRPWLLTRYSSFGILNVEHRLQVGPDTPLKYWAFLDAACFLRTMLFITLVAIGVYDWKSIAAFALMGTALLLMNIVRTICLHNYLSDGETSSYIEQFEDSLTLPNAFPAAILAPVGLRYHALHHLFPHLPYHSLGIAHRRLMSALPEGSEYHRTVRSGIGAIFGQLWKAARAKRQSLGVQMSSGSRIDAASTDATAGHNQQRPNRRATASAD
jgi:fatty acid desaturase